MKKAQITLFIILGIVIIIVFSMVFYAKTLFIERRSPGEEVKDVRTDTIRDFINDCLKNDLEEAVLLLGKQGGYIYERQGGVSFRGDTIKYKGDDVVYRITKLDPKAMWDVPFYPCLNFGTQNSKYCFFTHNSESIFGRAIYLSPCKHEIIQPYFICSAPNYVDSAEEQIEKFIETKIQDCELSNFESDFGYRIQTYSPSADATISNRGVSVRLNYSIIIDTQNGKVKLDKFKAKVNVRLKLIYDIVNSILGHDTNNITFDIVRGAEDFGIDGLSFKKEKLGNGDFIFTIEDSKSKIRGSNYIFQFAIKNRIPALDHINDITIRKSDLPYTIEALGFDPDEEPVTYNIEGLPSNSYKVISCKNPVTNVDEERCFKVNNLQSGNYNLRITVEDPERNKDWQDVLLKVN